MNNIEIKTIPHTTHRYPTCGDWLYKRELVRRFSIPKDGYGAKLEDVLHILASELSDERREALVMVHELIEALSCKFAGIGQEAIDKFDMDYEANRKEGDESEPGDAADAPYRIQHGIASGVERILAAAWGVDWADYEKELAALP